MRIAGETIGARGTAVLAVTAVVAIALGAHGWSGRNSGLPPNGLSGTGLSGTRPAASPSPSTPASQGPTAAPSRPPAQGPTAPPTPGPKLSSQSYASYAFLVWPGTPSASAKAAEIGLIISVRRQGTGLSVSAGVAGQSAPTAKYYPTGARVYVIEASLGDDSGNSDYNLGDDGLVVTDAQGRILQ